MADPRTTNLARRGEIDAEVLRQRRDLYVVSIGLLLFYWADGTVLELWTMTFIPAEVRCPQVFLWAAWIAFAYFSWRYWLVAPPAWKGYQEEVAWQLRTGTIVRRLARKLIDHPDKKLATKQSILDRCNALEQAARDHLDNARYGPLVRRESWRVVTINLSKLAPFRNSSMNATAREVQSRHQLEGLEILQYYAAYAIAFTLAIFRERSFSDYVLPYLVAGLAVAVALFRSGGELPGLPQCGANLLAVRGEYCWADQRDGLATTDLRTQGAVNVSAT